MKAIQIESHVGNDGVLILQVPLGIAEARSRVVVTIQTVAADKTSTSEDRMEWQEFIEKTYGSCAGLGLEEPDDAPSQERDWSE